MYGQSIPAIISKNVGNALTNYTTWGGILYNVKAGTPAAKGDGTDDTASIQATINTAIAAGGKAVFFPHGTYVATALTGLSSVVLLGDNASLTVGGIAIPITQLGAAQLSNLSSQSIINGNFDLQKRGTSWTNPAGSTYTADRWLFDGNADGGSFPTVIHTIQIQTPGDLPGSYYFYRISPNGSGSAFGTNSYYVLLQRIENGTRYLCGNGKKVTLSFLVRSSIAAKKIGVYLQQNYGSGGSPSASEILVGNVQTLSSTFTKITVTFTTNTLVGKIFGTNNDDSLSIIILYEWGSSYASTRIGTSVAETFIGSGNIDIAEVGLNAGDQALPFQPRSFGEEDELARRYCIVFESTDSNRPIGIGSAYSTTDALIEVDLGKNMRVNPALVATAADWRLSDGVTAIPLTAISILSGFNSKNKVTLNCSVASGLTQFRTYHLQAVGPNKKMIFDAEI